MIMQYHAYLAEGGQRFTGIIEVDGREIYPTRHSICIPAHVKDYFATVLYAYDFVEMMAIIPAKVTKRSRRNVEKCQHLGFYYIKDGRYSLDGP